MAEHVYQAIADGAPADAPIGHGQTYSAHPVSAAIALEVMRLYHDGGLLENGRARAVQFGAGLDALRGHPLVGNARYRGLLGALELVSDKAARTPFDLALKLPARLFEAACRNGIILRAFGDGTLGFAPALCLSESECEELFVRVKRTLDEVLDEAEVRAALRRQSAA